MQGVQGLQPKRASKAGAPAAAPNETPEERLQRLINTGAPTMQFSASADDSAPVSPPSSPRLAAKMPGFSLQPTVVDRIAPTQLVKYRIVADRACPPLLPHSTRPMTRSVGAKRVILFVTRPFRRLYRTPTTRQ